MVGSRFNQPRSQEVEFLVEGDDGLDAILDGCLLVTTAASPLLGLSTPVIADQDVELGDLVGILARSWHFDRPGPVEIAVAKGECQLLNLELFQRALIEGHEAVSR